MKLHAMWNWLKDNGAGFIAVGAILTFTHFFVVTPLRTESETLRREINQRFDAQDKRIDGLEAEMNQRFDAQDKSINQRFDAVDQRFDTQDKRIDGLEAEMNRRFDAQDRRSEDLAGDVSELRKVSEQVSRHEGQIDVIRQQLQTADAPRALNPPFNPPGANRSRRQPRETQLISVQAQLFVQSHPQPKGDP